MEDNQLMKSTAGQAIDALKKAYDHEVRSFLSEKSVLAVILKDCMEEFKGCSDRDIVEKYIVGEPQVNEVGVDRDMTNPAADSFSGKEGKIRGNANEDTSSTEGYVRYDIRFLVRVPVTGEPVEMIINVEAQREFYPGYPIIKRGLYYAARMLSAEKGVEFQGNHYGQIKKVCSIWICYDVPEAMENTIAAYETKERFIAAGEKTKPQNRADYDLMRVVLVGLGDPKKTRGFRSLRMLSSALSESLAPNVKADILENEIGIPMTESVEKVVDDMCNLSEGVWERGIAAGVKKGKKDGIGQSIQNLMETLGFTQEQAMDALKIPQNDRAEYRQALAGS